MLNRLLEHHILANLTFLLVMVIGWVAYFELPREQDPSVNFKWIEIRTHWPGAAAIDVEKRVTDVLEEGLKTIQGVRYVSSVSREGLSSIMVRFRDLGSREFDNRLADLRREVTGQAGDLPSDVRLPEIIEITSANAFPAATIVAWAQSDGTVLQREAQKISDDLERIAGVDRVLVAGGRSPELRVEFLPERLVGLGISPVNLAESISAYFRDAAAGKLVLGDQRWLVRLQGTSSDPSLLEQFPVLTADGEIPLRAVALVNQGLEDPRELVRYQGQPAVLFSVAKQERANNLDLLARVDRYISERNRFSSSNGVTLALLDDQTESTRTAIKVMESNAILGLALVMITVGLFLGWKTALIASVGIPFVLGGTFLLLLLLDQTLNTTVLLAIVISLGMLVDDAVVVVEAIQFHLARGKKAVEAARLGLSEVALPVTTAVLTTIAAFLPLILMPGLLGDFMRVVPIVVSVALLLSLVEAFWMLPSHMVSLHARQRPAVGLARQRAKLLRGVKRRYVALVVAGLRKPGLSMTMGLSLFLGAGFALSAGLIKVDFFATDLYRLFYVSVDLPEGTTLDKTLDAVLEVERVVLEETRDDARAIVSYVGQQITDKELLVGEERGQVFVSLSPGPGKSRTVDEIIHELRPRLEKIPGPKTINFVRRKSGPPTTSPISIKVRGDEIAAIRLAVGELKRILRVVPGVTDVSDDDLEGGNELLVRLNPDAITRAGVHPGEVARMLRLFATGEQVASMQYQGEKLHVRVLAKSESLRDIDDYLVYPVSLPGGGEIALGELLLTEHRRTESNIRHQDFRRAVTVEANIDPEISDTLRANEQILAEWAQAAVNHPGVSLDFSGELDDVRESLGSLAILFLFGLGLIYLILGTQFRSYTQPLIVLAAVPMAFIGVVFGLGLSGNPLSLFTLYGVVALAGIVANDAIVLVSTANRLNQRTGSPVFSAAQAAKRRFLPIVITSATTIAGLYSLAVGLGGYSLMWAPVATAIVWGLAFSTVLTLLLVPVIYVLVARRGQAAAVPTSLPLALVSLGSEPVTILGRLAGVFSPASRRARRELSLVLDDGESRRLFEQGVAAMKAGELETPIRCFERLAAAAPESLELHVLAAQANIRLMEVRGWDIGYANRARRHLARARAISRSDQRVLELIRTLEEIEAARDEEA